MKIFNRDTLVERKERMNKEREKLIESIVRMVRKMDAEELRILYRFLVHMKK